METIDFKLFIIERIRESFSTEIANWEGEDRLDIADEARVDRDGMIEEVKVAKDIREVTVIVGSYYEGLIEGMLIDFIERDIT